ncbi:MAG: transglutaminase domain-containing protein [Candidatus Sabulitectum sp.]|nr:transglutaminase domain-containing protein [Candidatus Sabulitectum sp.]
MNRAKGLFFAMITAFAITGCGAGAAEETIHESFATADFQKFAVSLQGEDVGYMTMETEAVGDSLFITQSMEWHLLLMGTTRTVTMEVSARTGTNMDLGYLTMRMSDGTSVIETFARRTGNTVETTVMTSGREIVNTSEFEGDYLPSFVDLAAATMDWAVGDEKIFPTFDPSTGMIFEATVTCEAIEDVSLMGDMVPAARLLIAQQGMRNSVWVYQGQIVREEETGMGMVLTRVALDTEDNIIPSSDLYEVYAVTSNTVRDPRRTGDRAWLLVGDVDWNEFELDYPGIQTLSDGPLISVTATIPQNPVVFPMQETSGELASYLEADAMIQCTDPVIIAVADSLTEGATDAWDAVTRISRFVDRAVENVPTVSLPSAVDVLDNKRGDCNEHTILTVALCRAVGIPAVTCAGIVYVDNGIFGYHAWPAVWVGEWVAIDPTFGQQVADCTHIVLAQGSLDAQYVVNGVLGRLSIEEYTGQDISIYEFSDEYTTERDLFSGMLNEFELEIDYSEHGVSDSKLWCSLDDLTWIELYFNGDTVTEVYFTTEWESSSEETISMERAILILENSGVLNASRVLDNLMSESFAASGRRVESTHNGINIEVRFENLTSSKSGLDIYLEF